MQLQDSPDVFDVFAEPNSGLVDEQALSEALGNLIEAIDNGTGETSVYTPILKKLISMLCERTVRRYEMIRNLKHSSGDV